MKKIILSTILSMVMVLSLTACGGSSESADSGSSDGVVKLRFSNVTTEAAISAGEKFCELVNEYSGGTIEVAHFPSNQLGDDKAVIEATQIGDIDIAVSSTSPLVNVYPDFYIYDTPYLFLSREDAINIGLNSETAQTILTGLDNGKIGLKGLAWWENGFRNLTNSQIPVKTPADVEGMKIRTMENDVHIAAWKALGANPTPMAFSELFTAMQQGTVDGEENPIGIITSNKFYEVQKYISLTEHVYTPYCVVMNADKFNSLTEDQQAAIEKAMAEATEFQLETSAQLDKDSISVIEDAGSEIISLTPEEKAEFQDTMVKADIFPLVQEKMEHPEYFDAIMDAMK